MSMSQLVHRLVLRGIGRAALGVTEYTVQLAAYKTQEALKSQDQKEKDRRELEERRKMAIENNIVAKKYILACWLCWLSFPLSFYGSGFSLWNFLLPIAGLVIRAVGLKLGYEYQPVP